MSSLTAQDGFRYSQLDEITAKFVVKTADEIRRLGTQTIENVLTIGKHLIEVKAKLGHGQWLPWLEAEFGWSDRTALRFMQSYEYASANPTPMSDLIRHLDPSSFYQLAAPSTPEPARQEVIARVVQGEIIPPKKIKEIVSRHRPGHAKERSPEALAEVRAVISKSVMDMTMDEALAHVEQHAAPLPAAFGGVCAALGMTPPPTATEVVDPAHEVLALYHRLNGHDQHVVAKRILEHQLMQDRPLAATEGRPSQGAEGVDRLRQAARSSARNYGRPG